MVWFHRWTKLLIFSAILSLTVPVQGGQLAKTLISGPMLRYTGTTSGVLVGQPGNTTEFTSAGGSWTLTATKRVSIKVTGVAGGGNGGTAVNDGNMIGAGGGGTGAYNSTGETVTLEPGTSYTITVGNVGGETHFRLTGSTYYMRLGGGATGVAGVAGGGQGGAGGTALTGTNSVNGADGGNQGHPQAADGSAAGAVAGSGGGGGGGNVGGVGGIGGSGGLGGQVGEVAPHDGGGRGGTGGGSYGCGGGGGGSFSSTGNGDTAAGRAGCSGRLVVTIL